MAFTKSLVKLTWVFSLSIRAYRALPLAYVTRIFLGTPLLFYEPGKPGFNQALEMLNEQLEPYVQKACLTRLFLVSVASLVIP